MNLKERKPVGVQIAEATQRVQEKHPELAAETDEEVDAAISNNPVVTEAPSGPVVSETPPIEAPVAAEVTPSPAVTPQLEEWENVEIEDGDNGDKYVVRSPKEYVQRVKDGYMRRSDYSRKTSKLAKHRQWFDPMIESGELDTIAPMIERANNDPELAQAFVELYKRRQANQPLAYIPPGYEQYYQPRQAQQPIAPASQAYQQTFPTQQQYVQPNLQGPIVGDDGIEIDEYTKNAAQAVLRQYLSPLEQRLQEQQQWIDNQNHLLQQQRQQQELASQQRAQAEQKIRHVHSVLREKFPTEFDGSNNDIAKLKELDELAVRAGYDEQTYGYIGRFEQARALKYSGYQQSQPQAAYSSSPAARSLADVEAQARAAASAVAATVANQTVTGTPIQPSPPQRLSYRGPDGKNLVLKEQFQRALQNAKARHNS